MSGVIHPVGPQNPKVYWVRRGLLTAAILSTLLLIAKLTFGGDPEPAAAVLPAPTQTELATVMPTETTSTAPTITTSPSPVATATTTCTDDQISVKVAIDPLAPKTKQSIKLAMTITNSSANACQRDVGSGANEITVISGPALIWSTDHCNPDTTADIRTLQPGQQIKVSVTWNGTQTSKGCVKHNLATAGTYWAHARNVSKNSDGLRFVISD